MIIDDEAGKSRTRKKRESTALQKRGEELAALSPSVLQSMPLTPELREAFAFLRTAKTREAGRRQMQYIGRLMREMPEEDAEALLNALQGVKDSSSERNRRFQTVERLRDALLVPDSAAREAAIDGLVASHAALSASRLRHLTEAAAAEREKKRPPKHARELFRYLLDGVDPGSL